MFHNIPQPILRCMQELEARDIADREDGTPRSQRLRQIAPETGRFLALLCAGVPKGAILEIGTSGGYSALWLAQACRQRGDTLTTFEVLPEKVQFAEKTFRVAGVTDVVHLIHADAQESLDQFPQIAFCFLDAEKEIYLDCYEKIVPNLIKGGLLVADNIISHREALQPFLDRALGDPRVDALVVPIGKGELVCRKA